MLGGEVCSVVAMVVYPGDKGGQGAVVEDGGAAVVAGETFRPVGWFACFLAGVEHDGATAETEEGGGDGAADVHAGGGPVVFGGEADLVVVLGVAHDAVEVRGEGVGGGVDVVGPLVALDGVFEGVVGFTVVNGVEA